MGRLTKCQHYRFPNVSTPQKLPPSDKKSGLNLKVTKVFTFETSRYSMGVPSPVGFELLQTLQMKVILEVDGQLIQLKEIVMRWKPDLCKMERPIQGV